MISRRQARCLENPSLDFLGGGIEIELLNKNSIQRNASDAGLRPPEPDPPQIGSSKSERRLLTRR